MNLNEVKTIYPPNIGWLEYKLNSKEMDYVWRCIENNKENWKYGGERQYFKKQDLLNYIRKAKTDIKIAQQYRFVIIVNKIPIGLIDLFDYASNKANVGIIIKKKYRRKGYGKEALDAEDARIAEEKIPHEHGKNSKNNIAVATIPKKRSSDKKSSKISFQKVIFCKN